MVRLAVISDTHIPSRATAIPDWVRERVQRADHTVHAGDFDSKDAYETIREITDGNLTAVRGNTDPMFDLPIVATEVFGGVPFVITHGTGNKAQYEERVASIVKEHGEEAVGISGHTHKVLDEEVDGVRLLNPGSATGAAPARAPTMMTVVAESGELSVTVHER